MRKTTPKKSLKKLQNPKKVSFNFECKIAKKESDHNDFGN
jgi:hypothetical protein